MKLIVSRNELLAALLFSSTDESRWTLSGVCIEAHRNKKPTMIATDGRRLVVIETAAEQSEEFIDSHALLLRPDFVRPICALSKAMGGKLFPWIEFENTPGSTQVTVTFVGGNCTVHSESSALIEGEFPDWRKVLPPKRRGALPAITDLGLNAEFVGDFAKAAKILESRTNIVQMSLVGKESQVEVKIVGPDNFYGLIMPCAVDEDADYQPEFVSIIKDLPKPQEPGELDVTSDKE